MEHLVDTKIEDLKQGDIFYRVGYDGKLVGPYMSIVFSLERATRKLPRGSFIGNFCHQKAVTSGFYAYNFNTKLIMYFTCTGNPSFKVDPTANVLIEGIPL